MTRKDYVLIAEAIKRAHNEGEVSAECRRGTFEAAHYIAFALRRTNPRFEKSRFMAACGFPAGE
jgi:hypothetical protein